MIGIKYIGTREVHEDNLYGTGLRFAPDEVHNVDETIAAKMLVHADVYKEAKAIKGEPAATANTKPDKLPIPLPNLEGMNKQELTTFAQQHYGEKMHHKMSEENMRSAILGYIQSRGR